METFSALLPICAGNSPVPGEFPAQRLVTRSFDVFFDLHPNKRLSKQWWGWWFEMPPCRLWRHRYDKHVSLSFIWGHVAFLSFSYIGWDCTHVTWNGLTQYKKNIKLNDIVKCSTQSEKYISCDFYKIKLIDDFVGFIWIFMMAPVLYSKHNLRETCHFTCWNSRLSQLDKN